MTEQQTLSAVAQHVVGQYNEANKALVHAYRAGALRAINSVGNAASRVDGFMGERQLPMLNEQVKTGLVKAHDTVAGFLTTRLERDTDRLVGAMDSMAQRTASGIESLAQMAERAEAAFNIKASEPLRALNMPMAQIASQIADRAVESAKQLQARVAGDAPQADDTISTAVVKAARRTARKAA